MSKKGKGRIDIVYSTNPDFEYHHEEKEEEMTLPPQQQDLRVALDKKQRAGKAVTLITGFIGGFKQLDLLGRDIKSKCGVGGSVKDGQILIQGDHRKKVLDILIKAGYKAKIAGG
ncbi:MAG: translation initiation factor [Flavobacteriales bacterium]